MKRPETVAIIGGKGRMGTIFGEEFEKEGIRVIKTGKDTEYSNKQVSAEADIVIITVPIRNTKEVIQQVAPCVKKDALLTDFTSVKHMPCEEMEKSIAGEVCGGHPVFGPTVNFRNQNFVLAPVRTNGYYLWYKNFLETLGLKVLEMSPFEHDKNMAVIQCLTHISNLSLGYALKKLNVDLDATRELSSPVYMMRTYMAGRILAQNESMYCDIQMENPFSEEMSKAYVESVEELYRTVLDKDKDSFEKIFAESRNFLGEIVEESMQATDIMIKGVSESALRKKKDEKNKDGRLMLLGPEYSYSDNLGRKIVDPGYIVYSQNIKEIFEKVYNGEVSKGLVPVENMLNGTVRDTLLNLKKYRVKINQAYDLRIKCCIASGGKDFEKIVSHSQSIGQCSLFLDKYREEGYEVLECGSTSKAMEMAKSDPSFAAIGTKEAAETNGLYVLQEGIENDENNTTRFFLISSDESYQGQKTSMIIEPHEDRPGLLYEILAVFKIKNINLTKLESIPSGDKIGNYMFFIEVDGSLNDQSLTDSLRFLDTFVKIYSFGSYDLEKI